MRSGTTGKETNTVSMKKTVSDMAVIHYYKTIDDVFVFENGVRESGPDASRYLGVLRKKGIDVERLYPDIPEHWAKIQSRFMTPDHWKDRKWQDAYWDR